VAGVGVWGAVEVAVVSMVRKCSRSGGDGA